MNDRVRGVEKEWRPPYRALDTWMWAVGMGSIVAAPSAAVLTCSGWGVWTVRFGVTAWIVNTLWVTAMFVIIHRKLAPHPVSFKARNALATCAIAAGVALLLLLVFCVALFAVMSVLFKFMGPIA